MKRITAILLSVILLCLTGCKHSTAARISGFAMDTDISVTVYGEGKTASEILAAVTALENEISWNVAGSATDTLNRLGEVRSQTLSDIIKSVESLYADTSGRYSLAVRELCALWDVTSGDNIIPSEAQIADTLSRTGNMPSVIGDTVRLSDGQAADLGSVGKGAACDIAAEIFSNQNRSGVAAIGSSIALCGSKPNGEKWSVTVAKPDDRNEKVGTLYLDGGYFVSTSSAAERGFESNGIRYHHIMDATTGYPAESDLKSVTVVAKSGIMSDALSTACFIVGYEQAVTLLEKYGASAVLITKNGETKCHGGLDFEVAK